MSIPRHIVVATRVNPDWVWRGVILRQPEFLGLLDVRHRIAGELAGYEFVTSAAGERRKTLRQVLSVGLRFE